MFNGANLLLYVFQSQEKYLLEGLKVTRFNLVNYLVELDNSNETPWRILAESSGNKSVTIMAGGICLGSKAEYLILEAAWQNASLRIQLVSESGVSFEGGFLVANYEKSGNLAEEENYSLLLESSGEVVMKM
jgi:predicted secreted protein